MLRIERVPDIPNGSIVLDHSTEGLNHTCNQCSRMNILFGLDARFNLCCISSSYLAAWSRVEGGIFGGVRISFCIVTSFTSGGRISCFMRYQIMSSAVQQPCRIHASAIVLGMASRSSVLKTLSTAVAASGMGSAYDLLECMLVRDWLFDLESSDAIDHDVL